MITRRRFLQVSAATAGLGVGAGLYAWRFEPHWLQIVERELPVEHLPESLAECRLAHLSDLHVGFRVDDDYLLHTFDRVRALSPDIVVYTGDLISYHAGIFEQARRMFAHLPLGRRATFGILGNHDYGHGWRQPEVADRIAELAIAAGVRILRNEAAEVDGLHLVGMDDFWAGRFAAARALAGLKPGAATLALSHNPDTVDLDGWGDYRGWILAGHTHGGQCKLPFFPPPVVSVRNRKYVAGEYSLSGGRRLYVNRGIGYNLRIRFNVRPEVTLFRLSRARPPAPSPAA
jgi:uncharacterized protein